MNAKRGLKITVSGCLLFASCATEPVLSPAEVVAVQTATLPTTPEDKAWAAAPVHVAQLLLQDMVEPRQLEVSTPSVRVQAATDGSRLAFRLEWTDPSDDNLPGISRYSDACAVQLPAVLSPDVPAPQMGETGRFVEIAYWSASWQASVDGRPDSIKELYPGATVDHYPFEAPALEEGSQAQKQMEALYSPARSLDNRMQGPRDKAVEDLVAEGPGTMAPAGKSVSDGKGSRTSTGWAVVIHRPLPEGLQPGGRTQAAFAVWEGSREEVGARKMRSGWIPLSIQEGQ